MKPELKARLARLGPIQVIDRVSSGSPETLVLRPADRLAGVRTIDAIKVLAHRGMTLLRAKRAIETMIETGEAIALVPTVESAAKFAEDLRVTGVVARRISHAAVDVKAIRMGLGLTQEQFAARFGLDVDAVQNWEQGRYQPDRPAVALLRAIAAAPKEVAAAQEEEMA